MNHSLYQDGILKALPFKRLPWACVGVGVRLRMGSMMDCVTTIILIYRIESIALSWRMLI
jgi:hypothetical protein